MRKIIPFHTGKVAIGSRFEPVKRYSMSADEVRIQNAFIKPPEPNLVLPYDKAIYVLGLVALLVVWLTR